MTSATVEDAHSYPDFASQLRTKTLEGLHTSQARNTDRYLGTAADHVKKLKAQGYPLNAGILKDLENTFATFHEEILSQAIALMTWGVASEESRSQAVVLRASEKAFDAARGYAERLAEDEWRRRVTPVVDSISCEEGQSPTPAIVSLTARLHARNQAGELWLRKQLFEAIMAVLYQRDLHQATVSNAQMAQNTKDLTAAMVRGTIIIAVASVLQALQILGFFDALKAILALH